MVVEERSRKKMPARGCIISYNLEPGEQKCLKAEHGATGHIRKDRAKMEK